MKRDGEGLGRGPTLDLDARVIADDDGHGRDDCRGEQDEVEASKSSRACGVGWETDGTESLLSGYRIAETLELGGSRLELPWGLQIGLGELECGKDVEIPEVNDRDTQVDEVENLGEQARRFIGMPLPFRSCGGGILRAVKGERGDGVHPIGIAGGVEEIWRGAAGERILGNEAP